MILHFFDNKKEGEPVIFIHGTASAHDIWEEQYRLLQKTKYRVIGIDLRGHGNSSNAGGICSIEDHINDILETLNFIGIEKSITFVGHSFGAVLAVKIAESFPQRVKKLLLASFPPKVPRIMCLYYKWFLGKPAKFLRKEMKWITKLPVLKRYKVALHSDLRIIRQIWRESLYWDFIKNKPNVKCPIYFSVGRFDNIASSNLIKELHFKIPNSKFTEFKWAAHSLMEDQPKEFNEWILSILRIKKFKHDFI